jgi:hypothetical protein
LQFTPEAAPELLGPARTVAIQNLASLALCSSSQRIRNRIPSAISSGQPLERPRVAIILVYENAKRCNLDFSNMRRVRGRSGWQWLHAYVYARKVGPRGTSKLKIKIAIALPGWFYWSLEIKQKASAIQFSLAFFRNCMFYSNLELARQAPRTTCGAYPPADVKVQSPESRVQSPELILPLFPMFLFVRNVLREMILFSASGEGEASLHQVPRYFYPFQKGLGSSRLANSKKISRVPRHQESLPSYRVADTFQLTSPSLVEKVHPCVSI